MEMLVNYDEAKRAKVKECDEWLLGQEKALIELQKAQEKLAEYTPENIAQVTNYVQNLKIELGIPLEQPII